MDSSTGEPVPTPATTDAGAAAQPSAVKLLTFDMTEKALVKALDSVTPEDILAFTSLLEVTQTDAIDISLYMIFEFQGFDPVSVIRKLLVINKHHRESGGRTEETLALLKEDVMFMIAANIFMGNLQKKSMSRRSASGRQKIATLVAKYAMKTGSTGAGLPSDVLTFPRVANSFPVLATRMAKVLPSKDFLTGVFQTKELPKFMRISAFASFCDQKLEGRTRAFLLHAVCSYSCDQTLVVHEGENKKKKVKKGENVLTPIDAYGLQWTFIEVASNSTVPSAQMKRAMMTEFEMEKQYSVLEPIVKNFRTLVGDSTPMVGKSEYESDIRDFISSKP